MLDLVQQVWGKLISIFLGVRFILPLLVALILKLSLSLLWSLWGCGLLLKKVDYDQVKEQLALALFGYDPSEELASGSACYLLDNTALLLRIEGKELVIVALAGDLAVTAKKLFCMCLMSQHINSARLHTKRIAEMRYLRSKGIPVELLETRKDEYVLGVNCGR